MSTVLPRPALPDDPAILARLRRRLAADEDTEVGRPARARAAVARALRAEGVSLPPAEFARAVRWAADHLLGLGPLEELLRRPGVTDVMVNGPEEVWVEQDGQLRRAAVAFADADDLLAAVRRAVAPVGGRIDRAKPFVDAQLPDGSRLHAVAAPVCDHGPVVTLRRFDARSLSWVDLAATGSVPPAAAELLRTAVAARRALVVCGRTGSGKTTLLQRLVSEVGADQRVVLIEDAPELRPDAPHVVRMSTRTASVDGVGEVTIAELVRQSLRMRPDRIIVGEVRGVEVADVLQALITGHEGCMTTVHASSGAEALVRLEGMALHAGLPLAAARAQLGSALDVLVALGRGPDGRRGVTEIAEIALDGDRPVAITRWRRAGWEEPS